MTASTTVSPPASKRKRATTKASATVLATCPVNGAGWCPYPFSPAQLERRLKAKAAAAQQEQKTKVKSVK
ncbi:MAG TPA: hypothetical protein V6C69_14590 [Trichormus sp.]|jgi:hypothetical protein